jgi:hypothetical protein
LGFRISWIAAQGPIAEVLAALGADTTGATGEYFDFPLSLGELPNGWTIVWSEDETYFDPERSAEISRHLPILSCWVNETVMHSRVIRFEDGEQIWAVWHEGDEISDHIDHFGQPPEEMTALIADARVQQANDEGVDYLFDVPLTVARNICGFKHDTFFEDVSFREITPGEPAPAAAETPRSASGWLARLLGQR